MLLLFFLKYVAHVYSIFFHLLLFKIMYGSDIDTKQNK